MWKVYKWNGHYIQGDFISQHSSESAAIKKAKKEIKFTFMEKSKINNDNLTRIWLDDKNHNPIGIIVKKKRG
jgi:hypothetical protein